MIWVTTEVWQTDVRSPAMIWINDSIDSCVSWTWIESSWMKASQRNKQSTKSDMSTVSHYWDDIWVYSIKFYDIRMMEMVLTDGVLVLIESQCLVDQQTNDQAIHDRTLFLSLAHSWKCALTLSSCWQMPLFLLEYLSHSSISKIDAQWLDQCEKPTGAIHRQRLSVITLMMQPLLYKHMAVHK